MTSPSDYIQLEVLKNSLESIADSMALTVVRTSRSSVVKTGRDFSTAVLSPRGELVGQGLCSPIHLGGMMPALKSCLERYESRIYPGDVMGKMLVYMDDNQAQGIDAAIEFLTSYEDVWTSWVTPDVAAKVKSSL